MGSIYFNRYLEKYVVDPKTKFSNYNKRRSRERLPISVPLLVYE